METILPSLYRPPTNYRKKYKKYELIPIPFTDDEQSRLDEILKKNRLENYTTHHLSPNSLFNYNKNYKTD